MLNEILKRVGYVLLGVLVAVIVMLLTNRIREDKQQPTLGTQENIETVEETETEGITTAITDYDAEAEAKLKKLQVEATAAVKSEETQPTVSANSIEAAKVKWIKDYPTNSAERTLEENMNIRSSYEETLATNAFDKKVIENSTIDFSDVKIAVLGDSITAAANLTEEEQTKYSIPALLQSLLGTKEVYNLAIGGSTISRAADSFAMVDRWDEIPADTDIIVVFGGTNDSLFENKWDYGELEYSRRMKQGTFCGDLDEMLGGIKYVYREHNENSYIKFLCVNPPSTILTDAVYNRDPGNMVHQSAFAEAINVIAPTYGFEVIDMYNNNLFNTHDADVNKYLMPDGVHANPLGYEMIAEHLASQIIQRIEQ